MLTKEIKDLYAKTFKPLKREIKKEIRKWRNLPCFWIGSISIIKMAILPKSIYRFNLIPIEILTQYFTDFKRTILNFICKNKKPQDSHNISVH